MREVPQAMTRQEKYPETSTFHYFNANPKNKITCDCVVRAVSTALEQDYTLTLMEMTQLQCELGYDITDTKLYSAYLELKGWVRCKQPRKSNNKKYTGEEWCKLLQKDPWVVIGKRRVVANIGGNHVVAIVDGKVWDIWDSTDGCIGNYWVKKI